MMQICLKDTEAGAGGEQIQQGIAPYGSQNPFELGQDHKQTDFMLLHQMQHVPETQAANPQGFFQGSLADH